MKRVNRATFPLLREKVSFRLDSDRLSYLERYAVSESVPVSWIIRHLVCRFIEEQRRSFAPLRLGKIGGES